jgi:phosphoglycerate dehydrogenase-like enzyme
MAKYKVLTSIPKAFEAYCGPMFDVLKEADCEVVDTWYAEGLPREEMLSSISEYDGAIIGLDRIDREVIEAGMPRFKVVSKFGVGVDNFDLKAASELGFVVCNVPGANSDAVADFAIMFMLAVARQLKISEKELLNGGFSAQVGPQLGGKTLGIIGLGNIGTRVALRAKYGFDMTVIANDIVERPDFAVSHRIEYVPKDEIYRRSDFVSLHIPLTDLTRGMIGERELKLMKPTAFLINTARGGIVKEDALYDALMQGVIAGAAVDPWENEPPVGSKLLGLDNCIATTHTAGSTPEAITKIGMVAALNVTRVLQGKKPLYTVTPDVVVDLAGA